MLEQVQQATGHTVELAWADQGYAGRQAHQSALPGQPAGPRTVCLRPRRQPAGLHPRQRRPARGHHSWRGGRQPPALLPGPAL